MSIIIGLELTTICNYKCSYCYAYDKYQHIWQKEWSKERFEKVFDFLKKLSKTEKITLHLLGGEPALSKYFSEILTLIDYGIHIRVFTNLSDKSLAIINNISKPIELDISIHSEYFEETFRNLQKLKFSNNYKIAITLLTKHSLSTSNIFIKKLPELKQFILDKSHQNIKINIEPIDNNENGFDYIQNIYKTEKKFKKVYQELNVPFSYQKFKEIYQNNIICIMNEFEISFNGDIVLGCSRKKIGTIDNISNVSLKVEKIFCSEGIGCPCTDILNGPKKIKDNSCG